MAGLSDEAGGNGSCATLFINGSFFPTFPGAVSGFLAGRAQFNIFAGGLLDPTGGGTSSISEAGLNQLFLDFMPAPEPST